MLKKISYNAPVILTFSLVAVCVYLIDTFLLPQFTLKFFVVRPTMSLYNPLNYYRLVSHILGHSSWQHLFGNLTFILLLGPILEEKYSSFIILAMILLTGFFTGIINVCFLSTGLLGASGIVFMLIILSSIVDIKKGEIPLTFILVAGIFIGTEMVNALRFDQVSQMAHILGGSMGALFGFLFLKPSADN